MVQFCFSEVEVIINRCTIRYFVKQFSFLLCGTTKSYILIYPNVLYILSPNLRSRILP